MNIINTVAKIAVAVVSIVFCILIPVFGNTTHALNEDQAIVCLKDITETEDRGKIFCTEIDILDLLNETQENEIQKPFDQKLDVWESEVLPK